METKLEIKNGKLNDNVLHNVLLEISEDRRTAFDSLKSLNKELNEQIEFINTRDAKLVEEYSDLNAELRSVQRYEKHLSKQDFDAKKREVQSRFDEVSARHKIASKKAQEEIAPLQERIQSAQLKVTELTSEWRTHLRMAKAADLDLTQYWTPENPIIKA